MSGKTQRFDPRQHMRRASFEIFHYHDSRPDSVEVHHHDFYEVYFFIGGKAQYRVDGRIYNLEMGDLLLINPMELHQPVTEPGSICERFVLWINKAYLESLVSKGERLTRCFDSALPTHTNLLRPTPKQRAEIALRLGDMVRESYGDEFGGEIYAQGVFEQFMVELNRIALKAQTNVGERTAGAARSALVSQVVDYIAEHYMDALTLESLAKRFYVSKYHLSHEFSRSVGTSVYRYITLKRLVMARQMLARGINPGVVFSNCGFGEYTNFYRAFKSQYGISPRDCMEASGGE